MGRKMEDHATYCAKFTHLIQPAREESHASTTIYQDRNIDVLTRLSAPPDRISRMYLAQYPRLPCCVLFYIKLIILW